MAEALLLEYVRIVGWFHKNMTRMIMAHQRHRAIGKFSSLANNASRSGHVIRIGLRT
jgi:hypothetical protein